MPHSVYFKLLKLQMFTLHTFQYQNLDKIKTEVRTVLKQYSGLRLENAPYGESSVQREILPLNEAAFSSSGNILKIDTFSLYFSFSSLQYGQK